MSNEQLKNLALSYISFMRDIGSIYDKRLTLENVLKLFDENVCKIENGISIAQGYRALIEQLKKAITFAFPWRMEILDVICDKEQNIVVIRFSWDSKIIGLHITSVILKFNSKDKIIEINEVYNKFAGITH
jgi:hypothetical protein